MDTVSDAADRRRLLPVLVLVAFFSTGLTALSAEVVFNRLLSYLFGSSHHASATVLAAYMMGISLGSYALGRWSSRLRRPIAAYAMLELVVALFYAATPVFYTAVRGSGLELARAFSDDAVVLTGVRFVVAFAFVLVPTLFMGGTLPVLMAAVLSEDRLGRQLPHLYAVNTLGAAAGTLLSAYAFVPALGLDGTLSLCAVLNLAVAASSYFVSTRLEAPEGRAAVPAVIDAAPERAASPGGFSMSTVAALAFGQGAIVFVLEVVWAHLIGTVIGVTVFAFALMLSAILLGIGVGSSLLPWLRRRIALSNGELFVAAQIAIAVTVMASLLLWDRFPFVINLTLELKPAWSFAEREAVRFAFCALLLMPTTVAMGVALPALAAARPAPGNADVGSSIGRVFAANTLGAITGSLLCGFGLLGRIESPTILRLVSVGALLLAAAALRRPVAARRTVFHLVTVGTAACATLGVVLPDWDPARLTAGTHVYWRRWDPAKADEMVFVREDAQAGFITVTRQPSGLLVMYTNGKYESSNAQGEFQDFLSVLSALYVKNPERAFLIGLGGGRTLSLLHEMPFRSIDVAEISPNIVQAARQWFGPVSGAALGDTGRVHVAVDDGRNRLQVSREPYDAVIVAVSAAAFAGAGNLYNRDFFEVVRSRLRPDGVFLLWMQLHHLPERMAHAVIFALRSTFPSVHVYALPNRAQSFLVASPSALRIDRHMAGRLAEGPRVRATLRVVGFQRMEELVAWGLMTNDEEVQRYLSLGRPLKLTDLNPEFEYVAARGLAEPILGLKLRDGVPQELPLFDPPLAPGEAEGLLGLRHEVLGDEATALARFQSSERLLGQPRWRERIERLLAVREGKKQAASGGQRETAHVATPASPKAGP